MYYTAKKLVLIVYHLAKKRVLIVYHTAKKLVLIMYHIAKKLVLIEGNYGSIYFRCCKWLLWHIQAKRLCTLLVFTVLNLLSRN